MPPTSRPPIALGWPVSENGPAPGLPICAGGQVQVDQRRILGGAADDWFRPWQYSDSAAFDCGEPARGRVSRSSFADAAGLRATLSGVQSRTVAFSSSKPSVWRAM
jgi:hypothetical protein